MSLCNQIRHELWNTTSHINTDNNSYLNTAYDRCILRIINNHRRQNIFLNNFAMLQNNRFITLTWLHVHLTAIFFCKKVLNFQVASTTKTNRGFYVSMDNLMAFIMINNLASDATSRNQITVDAIVVVVSFDFLHSQPVCSVFGYCEPRIVNCGVSCFIIVFWILCHKSVRCKIL